MERRLAAILAADVVGYLRHGSPFMTGVVFPEAAVNWLQGDRAFYQSSTDYRRSFCPNCGSWLTHEGEEKVWLYVGSMDEPEALPMQSPRGLGARTTRRSDGQ